MTIRVGSEAETIALGKRLAPLLDRAITISLSGTLGAGKTRLVKGIASGMGIDQELVVSPTFSIANLYDGARRINHLDVYRINDDDEFLELGVDELFESDAVNIIEWGERFAECLPDEYLQITINIIDDDSREFIFITCGTFDDQFIGKLEAAFAC